MIDISKYESGDLNDWEIIELFADLIKEKELGSHPGYHRRLAKGLIEQKIISPEGDILKSKDEIDWVTREVVEDGVNGLLIQVRDPEALRAAIVKRGDDVELRQRMAAAWISRTAAARSPRPSMPPSRAAGR